MDGVASSPALPNLLSQALVALTIEFDNEFEHRMPHRTTEGPAAGSRRGPWLVSQPMWSNFLQFVATDGMVLGQLRGHASLVNLTGLQRWGYIVLEPDAGGPMVGLGRGGRAARRIWRPLATEIEQRWEARFGPDDIAGLRHSLIGLLDPDDPRLVGEAPDSPTVGGSGAISRQLAATVRKPDTLPHYPMVLHRGGYPDGS